MIKTCSDCELESDEKGYIIETEDYGQICQDCLYDRRISYYDIEKAVQMSEARQELRKRGN